MRKVFAVGVVFVSAFAARAQDIPAYEVYTGFDYARFNPPHTGYFPPLNAFGGGGQFIFNIKQFS